MLTFVVSSTIIVLSSVVVRKIVIIVVSMEMGGEVVGMIVGDSDIDEIVSSILDEVLVTAISRSLPVTTILDIELIILSLLLGVGTPSTFVVEKL
jgi:hypothetical protein